MLRTVQRNNGCPETIDFCILEINMGLIEIILNASAGKDSEVDTAGELLALFEAHGIDVRICDAGSGSEIVDLAKLAAESDSETVVAGGGDGTISAVAAAIVGTGKTMGVLPLGTLNHFGKDLNIPADLAAAVNVIAAGYTIDVDVGEVNKRVFINNSSLGLYPDMVRGRELRQRLGYGKWHSLARSALTVFRRYPLLAVRLNADGKDIVTHTPFIFIGNNEYEIESFSVGGRERLDAGHLSVYMTRRSGRLALLRIAIKTIFGGLRQEKDFHRVMADEVVIETRKSNIRVALDGEVAMMSPPLKYTVRPGALKVIVPEPSKDEVSE